MGEGNETLEGSEEGPGPAPGRPGGDGELLETTLIDRYQVERRLGTGGMGVVYAARDVHLGRTVAVKVVGPWIDGGSGPERLVREAQAMAKVRHANLATVFDIGVSRGRLFVVMELVEGGTLDDWLRAEPRSWREVVTAYLQAARGLAAAHGAGFVHRDFKPENVLVGKDGVVRVGDFGVARLLGDEERVAPGEGAPGQGPVARTAGVVGTPGYIAPEILRREPVDGRADQFSFCVALYTALYRERPFQRLEGPSRLAETLGPLRPPPPGVGHRWLSRIIIRGLAADPRDRWPTMDALVAATERGLVRRRRTLLLLGSVVTTAAMVLVTSLLARSPPASPPDWSPVAIERETRDGPLAMVVSPDGSTLASISPHEAWIERRDGGGTRRRFALPFPSKVVMCRLSRTGDRLFCSFDRGRGDFEIWALDVATSRSELRVPSAAAPALRPGRRFDVGPDGSILFGVPDLTAVWSMDASGASKQVLAAGPGELLTGWAWSPDGTRIALRTRTAEGARVEVMTTGTRIRTLVSRRICGELEWLTEASLACAPRNYRNPVVLELLLPVGAGLGTERLRYSGPEYQQVSGLSASSAGVLLSTSPNDQHLGLLNLDGVEGARRVSSGGITDLPPVGWTASGTLIFGANMQGHLRIMALRPDGRVETVHTGPAAEVPLAVLGEAIVFGRFPGGESTIPFFETPFGRRYPDGELFRIASPGAAAESLGRTRGFTALFCASGEATSCLLVERSGTEVDAVDWDPATGARGRPRARWSLTRYASVGAVSPDRRTLAQVQRVLGHVDLSLLDLESGARRRVHSADLSLDFPRWRPDGTLLAVGASDRERGIFRVRDSGEIERVAVVPVPVRTQPTAAAGEFEVTRDGKTAAILMTDSLQTHWWIPRSQD
jgi:serine/threonine protein kinase